MKGIDTKFLHGFFIANSGDIRTEHVCLIVDSYRYSPLAASENRTTLVSVALSAGTPSFIEFHDLYCTGP